MTLASVSSPLPGGPSGHRSQEQWITAGLKHRASEARAKPSRASDHAELPGTPWEPPWATWGFHWGYVTAPALYHQALVNGLCHLVMVMANLGGTCKLGN